MAFVVDRGVGDAAPLDPVVQIACSSEEYGLVKPDEVPIRETNPLRPLSPYAVSKVAQDFLGYQYFQSYGIKAIRTRGFNHTGPRRGDVFVVSNFAKQLARIEAGEREATIRVGNLEAVRDFTDVRDMVRAYWLAAEKAAILQMHEIQESFKRRGNLAGVIAVYEDVLTKTDNATIRNVAYLKLAETLAATGRSEESANVLMRALEENLAATR